VQIITITGSKMMGAKMIGSVMTGSKMTGARIGRPLHINSFVLFLFFFLSHHPGPPVIKLPIARSLRAL
jgi:hypothetical protein